MCKLTWSISPQKCGRRTAHGLVRLRFSLVRVAGGGTSSAPHWSGIGALLWLQACSVVYPKPRARVRSCHKRIIDIHHWTSFRDPQCVCVAATPIQNNITCSHMLNHMKTSAIPHQFEVRVECKVLVFATCSQCRRRRSHEVLPPGLDTCRECARPTY